MERGCAHGQCPLTSTETASYRFLPVGSDPRRLAPVWQPVAAAIAAKPGAWMMAIDVAGKTVVDQAWPASVAETLAVLQKHGGP